MKKGYRFGTRHAGVSGGGVHIVLVAEIQDKKDRL